MENKEIYIRLEQKKPLILGNKTFLCANDFRLTKFDLEIACQEIHETEETKIKSLRKLKEFLSKDRTAVYCTDDDFLLRYLRVAKFDCEKAYKVVKQFYALKMKYPDFLILSPELEKFLEHNFIRRLPYKDENGCIIFWSKIKNWKTEEMSFNNLMQLYFPVMDIMSMIPCMQVAGVISIIDFQGYTISQVKQFLFPSHLLLFAKILQESYPWRVKRVILLNINSYLRACYSAVRQLMKKKIADRIIMIGSDMSELHQYVNPLLLPKEFGGSVDEEECSITRLVMDNLQYAEYQRSFGAVSEN